MHEWTRDVGLQLDDGETQRGDGETPGSVDGAAPLELRRRGQAELVGEVAPLVVVLAVLVLVQGQDVGAVLVVVVPVFPLLAQFEHVVDVYPQISLQEAETRRLTVRVNRRRLEKEQTQSTQVCEQGFLMEAIN